MGACDPVLPGAGEATVKYHSFWFVLLTREQAREQRLVGSLTGAVASQNVTEARDGTLSLIGNQASSALA